MKILYAIQGTGNGHLSRAREIIPHLLNHGELDLLISGNNTNTELPYLIKYRKYGLSFNYGNKGEIDYIDSIKKLKPFNFIKDIFTFPVHHYDLIINDFEPITAWACQIKKKPCIALSHQSSFLSNKTPRPDKKEKTGEWLLKNYAPVSNAIGLHFNEYDSFIKTPIIRKEVREQEPKESNHITIYLPAYSDQFIEKKLLHLKEVEWHIFSKSCKKSYRNKHIHIDPIENKSFLKSLAASSGLITGGGFEGPAEALFLNKKVMSIPIIGQYEQYSNAIALKKMGVRVVAEINENFHYRVKNWLEFDQKISVNYQDNTEKIIENVVNLSTVKESQTENLFNNRIVFKHTY
ncbi:MAG: glycosyl transferase [Bacteroidetes bacterium]|nr:glycosyl transferase [Bacteroidota bacterium]